MALTPGMKCGCGCGCALPKTPSAMGCPCRCSACNLCNSRIRASRESAPATSPGRPSLHEPRSPTVPAKTATPEQFGALLDKLTEAVRTASAAAPQAPAPVPVAEAVPLHKLSTDELSRRFVRQLAETHKSPWWRGVNENAGAADTEAPQGLAEQVQALPARLQSMSLAEAMASAHDLHSPSWSRPDRALGVRTVFDA